MVIRDHVAQAMSVLDQGVLVNRTAGLADEQARLTAALVARTTIYENPDLFAMDKELEDSDVGDLVDMCVELRVDAYM